MKTIPVPDKLKRVSDWGHVLVENMTNYEKGILGTLSIILLISATMSVQGYVQRNSHLIPQSGGTYVEAAVGQPRHINPILAGANDLDMDISSLVYSGLFKLNNDLKLTPDLATDYSVSSDGTTYTVNLRNDVVWHDGQPFTAEDVLFTIRSIQTPDYGSPLETSFQGVTVEKTGDHQVIFTLKQPYAPFPTNLTVGIAPKHVWENIAPKNAALAEQMLKPVGTGPFEFAELSTRRKTGEITTFRMVRNPDYYKEAPYLDEFIFQFYPTNEEAVTALSNGNVDGVGFVPLSSADDIENRTSTDLERLLLPQYFAFFFNELNNELLGDAGVRAALALAVDRDVIVEEALQGEAQSLHVPIPPSLFEGNSEIEPPTFNPEVAKQNLEEAGWKDEDGNGIREKDDNELKVTITTTDWPEFVRTAELVKDEWEKIGVGVEIQSYSAGVIQQTVVGPRDYEILLYGEILPADPDPYPFWHSTQTRSPGLNLSLLKDEEIDKLLEEARKETDQNTRREKYVEFQKRFFDLTPAIILYQPYYLYGHRDNVRGMGMENVNLPTGRFNDVESWHVNVKRVWNNEG